MLKPIKRDYDIHIRLTEKELQEIVSVAEKEKMPASTLVRKIVLECIAIKRPTKSKKRGTWHKP